MSSVSVPSTPPSLCPSLCAWRAEKRPLWMFREGHQLEATEGSRGAQELAPKHSSDPEKITTVWL